MATAIILAAEDPTPTLGARELRQQWRRTWLERVIELDNEHHAAVAAGDHWRAVELADERERAAETLRGVAA